MNPIKGTIIAAKIVETRDRIVTREFTVSTTQTNPEITLGKQVTTFPLDSTAEGQLRALRFYFRDRPSLMNQPEVKQGVIILNQILGEPNYSTYSPFVTANKSTQEPTSHNYRWKDADGPQ